MPQSDGFSVRSDEWLSQFLKKRASHIDAQWEEFTAAHVESLSRDLNDVEFCDVKIPTDRVDLLQGFAHQGFQVVDTCLTFEQVEPLHTERPSSVVVRDFVPEDERVLLRIAENSFRFSRFHLDPLIGSRIANEIKREWVRNYLLKKRGDFLWVGESVHGIGGFLAVLKKTVQSTNTVIIDLIGIDPEFQRQGIGTQLIQSLLRHVPRGSKVMVGTQAANTPSVRLYERLGFRLERSEYVLHWHHNRM